MNALRAVLALPVVFSVAKLLILAPSLVGLGVWIGETRAAKIARAAMQATLNENARLTNIAGRRERRRSNQARGRVLAQLHGEALEEDRARARSRLVH